MRQRKNTFDFQSQLTAYALRGGTIDIPGIKNKHIHHYHRLVYNNYNDSLQTAYPLTYNLLGEKEWDSLVKNFLENFKSNEPQIWKMPEGLLTYLSKENKHPLNLKYPFLINLLQMEWLEVEVFMMEDEEPVAYTTQGSIQADALVLNPEFRICVLEYPVHLKKAKQITVEDKGQYFLWLHRHPESGKVFFTDLNIAHVQLLDVLTQNHCCSFKGLLPVFEQYTSRKKAEKAILHFIENALENRLILGFRK